MSQKRAIALQTTTTLLALAVGILIGQRACAPKNTIESTAIANSASAPEIKIVERLVPSPPEIIYECPPEPTPPPKPGTKTASKTKPSTLKPKALPPAPAPSDPLERQRLLAWVRQQSTDLEPCRDNSKNVYRLTVNLHLDYEGAITRVDINTDTTPNSNNTSPATLTCIRNRIATWQPPTELTQNRTRVVFGLTF